MKAICHRAYLYQHSSLTSPLFQTELVFSVLMLMPGFPGFPLVGTLPSGNSE